MRRQSLKTNNMKSRLSFAKKQGGFTLIEVMLVIVIMAIMAGLIVMNLQGVDQRRGMQAREMLAMDLKRIRLEALDQGRVLGLLSLPATDIAPASYQVVEYVKQVRSNQNSLLAYQTQQQQYVWQAAKDFQIKKLPAQTHLTIQMLEHHINLDALKSQDQQELPQVIWLGNGETIPARFQIFMQQQAIGEALELNRLGLVVTNGN